MFYLSLSIHIGKINFKILTHRLWQLDRHKDKQAYPACRLLIAFVGVAFGAPSGELHAQPDPLDPAAALLPDVGSSSDHLVYPADKK